MLPNFLIPETIAREGGSGPVVEVPNPGHVLMVTLGINQIIEQESLDVLIYGSTDGEKWSAKPLLRFPQKFYCGTYTMVLDLSSWPDTRFLRADFKANRWGRGDSKPLFGFYLFAEETADEAVHASAFA